MDQFLAAVVSIVTVLITTGGLVFIAKLQNDLMKTRIIVLEAKIDEMNLKIDNLSDLNRDQKVEITSLKEKIDQLELRIQGLLAQLEIKNEQLVEQEKIK